MPPAARSRPYSRDLTWAGEFARNAVSSALSASVMRENLHPFLSIMHLISTSFNFS